jgi:hypothetical protein
MDIRRRRRTLAALIALAVLLSLATVPLDRRPAAAAGSRIVYTYQVRGDGNRSSLEAFAADAAGTYADPRGWSLGGSIAFRRVASGGEFTLWLAAASQVPTFGSICDSEWSCTVGRNVIINETRWLTASPSWNASHHTLADYRHLVVNHETGHWLGFGHQFCGGPGQLAPVMQQQSISLQGCQPNAWPLPFERQRLAASRGVPIITGYPIGSLDAVAAGLASLRITGWMIDPDTAAAGRVEVTVDGGAISLPANLIRADLGRAHPGYGAAHGFALTLTVRSGRHLICAYAGNLAGPGGTSALGCHTAVVSASPTGHLDSVSVSGHVVIATGWTIDPDTVGSNRVAVYVDAGGKTAAANLTRPDLGRAYPHFGPAHGFSVSVPAAPGVRRVCAYGINSAGAGSNVLLSCTQVRVS